MKEIRLVILFLFISSFFSCKSKLESKEETGTKEPFWLRLSVLSHFEPDSLNDYYLIPGIAIIIQKPDSNYLKSDCEDYNLFFTYKFSSIQDTVSVRRGPYQDDVTFFTSRDSVLEKSFDLDTTKYFKSLSDIHSKEGVRGMRDLMHHIAKEGKLYFRSCEDTFLIERHPEYEIRFRDPASVNVIAM